MPAIDASEVDARKQVKAQVVVVGGGPAGAVAAATLAGRGLRVLVLEARPRPPNKVGECLPPGATPMLQQLGLDATMEPAGHRPCLGFRSVWGDDQPNDRDFLFGTRGHGWLLDRRRFEQTLARIAVDRGAVWGTGWRLSSLDRSSRSPTWRLAVSSAKGDRTIEADFLIDASGRAAVVARKLGREPQTADSMIGIARHSQAPTSRRPELWLRDRYTLVEACEHGWWYSAILANGSLVTVFHTDPESLALSNDETNNAPSLKRFLSSARHTQKRILDHGGSAETWPKIRSAGGSRLDRVSGLGWLAAGDAAACFDPLSSYGITSAMGTGFYGAQAVADWLDSDSPDQKAKATAGYQAILEHTWQSYLEEHQRQYRLEGRWPDSPFWKRRRESPTES